MNKQSTHRHLKANGLQYRIPKLWNCWGYRGPTATKGSECIVDPNRYFSDLLQWIKGQGTHAGRIRGRSLSQFRGENQAPSPKQRGGNWIRKSIVYGMLIRSATAWDHDRDGRLQSKPFHDMGSFCKTILLLPHIKRLGADAIYLLPVCKVSNAYRKGELGCPYATKDFFALDESYADLTLGSQIGDVEDQFRLLVDCAHRLNMRVLIDIAPRTVARDHDWILDHPEWFYWIDTRYAKTYKAPEIAGITYENPIPGRLAEIYEAPSVQRHLRQFHFAPSQTDPQRWSEFVRVEKCNPRDGLIRRIQKSFRVTTAPGFCDVINDPQPPWDDVTYLRLFSDHPTEPSQHLKDPSAQPPYINHDTGKSSVFEGKKPHRALWNKLANIIPYYQRFGIDGARIDMAHALPNTLEKKILEQPRQRDPDFCFIAEELGTENHAAAKAVGYNLLIGPSWWMQPRAREGKLHEMVEKARSLSLPIFATAESADTPRSSTRPGKRKFAKQMAVLNCVLPNSVPMINSGVEVYEKQPANLGLDAKPSHQFSLPKDDPFYGKLAFFDKAIIHWTHRGGIRMAETIAQATRLRRKYITALTRKSAVIMPAVAQNARNIFAIAYQLKSEQAILLVIANLDYKKPRRTKITNVGKLSSRYELLLSLYGDAAQISVGGIYLKANLRPGECLIARVPRPSKVLERLKFKRSDTATPSFPRTRESRGNAKSILVNTAPRTAQE